MDDTTRESSATAFGLDDVQVCTQHLVHIANDLAREVYGMANDLLVASLVESRGGNIMDIRNRDFLRAVQARVNLALEAFAEIVPPSSR